MRRELTEAELREFQRLAARSGEPRLSDMAERLLGELRAARDREASVMHMHELEGRY